MAKQSESAGPSKGRNDKDQKKAAKPSRGPDQGAEDAGVPVGENEEANESPEYEDEIGDDADQRSPAGD
jgi:hypothetical protein